MIDVHQGAEQHGVTWPATRRISIRWIAGTLSPQLTMERPFADTSMVSCRERSVSLWLHSPGTTSVERESIRGTSSLAMFYSARLSTAGFFHREIF